MPRTPKKAAKNAEKQVAPISVMDGDKARLEQLIDAKHPCIRIVTTEEADALELLRLIAHERDDAELRGWSATQGVHNGLLGLEPPGMTVDTLNPAGALRHLLEHESWRIAYLLDLADHLRDESTLRALRDLIERSRQRSATLVLVDHHDRMPGAVVAHATPFVLSPPDAEELETVVRAALTRLNREKKLHIDITRGQLDVIIKNLRGLTRRQAIQVVIDAVAQDRRFTEHDIDHVLASKRRALMSGGLLEYVETPSNLDHIGGMKRLKQWLALRQFGDHKEAEAFGVSPPRGMMLLGVQGAGKSLCAKAVAAAWRRPLLHLDPSGLYDRFIGESERHLRDALHQAQAMAPIVLWIDEIEKGFASASSHNTDGGLSRRMFGSLLTWMQEHVEPVFLVATANDIEALPPELLRKGRFDEIFFVDLPDQAVRRIIFSIHLKKRGRDPEKFDLEKLAQTSDGFSGAEIEQAVIAALYRAYGEKSELTDPHILDTISQSPPLSVTMAEKVSALRRWAKGRCAPAD